MKKYIIAISILVVALGILVGIKGMQIGALIQAGKAAGEYPETVATGTVLSDHWEVHVSATGNVEPYAGTTIRSEAEGVVESIHFIPGSHTTKGECLVKLNDDIESAQLNAAIATLDFAKATVNRSRELFSRGSVPQSELDTAEAAYKNAVAQVENAKAIQSKKTLKSPFDGKLGIKQISVGNYINRGDAIVSLQNLSKVLVNCSIPQHELALIEQGHEVRITSDTWPNIIMTGEITALEPALDDATRTIQVQATLDNSDSKLRPGMFVNVKIIHPEKRLVTYIAQTAILNQPFGDTVFVVVKGEDETKLRVEQRIVRTGETKGDFIEITEGLKAGETIVTEGAFKLSDGTLIHMSNKGTIEPKLAPTPDEA